MICSRSVAIASDELPTCLVPCKRYDAESIEAVAVDEGTITGWLHWLATWGPAVRRWWAAVAARATTDPGDPWPVALQGPPPWPAAPPGSAIPGHRTPSTAGQIGLATTTTPRSWPSTPLNGGGRNRGRPGTRRPTTLIVADGGGSHAARARRWKVERQRLATASSLTIHVSHFPPETSKWNYIEHRLFSFIPLRGFPGVIIMNGRGRPLTTFETIVDVIGHTRTQTGLTVWAEWDQGTYPTAVRLTKEDMEALALAYNAVRCQWNYTISPQFDSVISSRALRHRHSRLLIAQRSSAQDVRLEVGPVLFRAACQASPSGVHVGLHVVGKTARVVDEMTKANLRG